MSMSGFLFAEMKQINTIFVSAPSFIFKQTFLSSVFLSLSFSCPSSCFKSCNVISYFEIQQNLSCNGNSSVVLKFRRPGPLVFQLCKTEKFLRKKSCGMEKVENFLRKNQWEPCSCNPRDNGADIRMQRHRSAKRQNHMVYANEYVF